MNIYSQETGQQYFTQMEFETSDIFNQQSHCSRLDLLAAQQYFECQNVALSKDINAQDKLEAIGLTDFNHIKQFRLGYGNGRYQKLILDRNTDQGKKIRGRLRRLDLIRSTGHAALNGGIFFPLYYDIDYLPSGVYVYWVKPKEGFEPDTYKIWGKQQVGVFNLNGLNAHPDLIITQSPVLACQLSERKMDNVISVMANGDTVEQYYRLFKHMPTETVRIISNGSRYGLFWKEQLSEAFRLLNIDCKPLYDA